MSATYNPGATVDDATWVAVLLVGSYYIYDFIRSERPLTRV